MTHGGLRKLVFNGFKIVFSEAVHKADFFISCPEALGISGVIPEVDEVNIGHTQIGFQKRMYNKGPDFINKSKACAAYAA